MNSEFEVSGLKEFQGYTMKPCLENENNNGGADEDDNNKINKNRAHKVNASPLHCLHSPLHWSAYFIRAPEEETDRTNPSEFLPQARILGPRVDTSECRPPLSSQPASLPPAGAQAAGWREAMLFT